MLPTTSTRIASWATASRAASAVASKANATKAWRPRGSLIVRAPSPQPCRGGLVVVRPCRGGHVVAASFWRLVVPAPSWRHRRGGIFVVTPLCRPRGSRLIVLASSCRHVVVPARRRSGILVAASTRQTLRGGIVVPALLSSGGRATLQCPLVNSPSAPSSSAPS